MKKYKLLIDGMEDCEFIYFDTFNEILDFVDDIPDPDINSPIAIFEYSTTIDRYVAIFFFVYD